MNYSLILLLIIIIVINKCATIKQNIDDRLGPFVRYDKNEKKPSDSPVIFKDECDLKYYPSKEIQISFKNLATLGEPDIVMSDFGVEQAEYCASAYNDLEKFKNHVNCLDKRYRPIFKIIEKGLKKAVRDRCNSPEWHKKFTEIVECVKALDIYDEFHSCYDKIYESFAYILRKVPVDDQLFVTCCPTVHLTECIHNVSLACGTETAEFLKNAVWQPFAGLLNMVCKGMYEDWCSLYPTSMRQFGLIFASDYPKKQYGVYGLLFQIIKNFFEKY